MTYEILASTQYIKDARRLEKSGKDMRKLQNVISSLASGELLPKQYKDHQLKGRLQGRRACHIGPDWLLIYRKDKERLLLLVLRTGTHRSVLGIE